MRKNILKFVQDCQVYQLSKYSTTTLAGLLQSIPIPAQVWDDITFDFIESLPHLERVDTILVVVDKLSKYAHFIGLKHPFTTISIASIFVKEIVHLHGIT